MIPPDNLDHINFKTHIILQSGGSPVVEFILSKKAAKLSVYIANIVENESKTIIPLPDINAKLLEHIVVYLEYHADYPAQPIIKPLKKPIENYIADWDYQFLINRFDNINLKSVYCHCSEDLHRAHL